MKWFGILLILLWFEWSDARMLKVLSGSAGFGSSEERRRNPLSFLGFSTTTQPSLLNRLFNQQGNQQQYGQQSNVGQLPYGIGNQIDPRQYYQPTAPSSFFGGGQPQYNQNFQPTTPGFPFNLFPTTTTTEAPFPMNIINSIIPQPPSLIPNPLAFLMPTTQRPFPFNLLGWLTSVISVKVRENKSFTLIQLYSCELISNYITINVFRSFSLFHLTELHRLLCLESSQWSRQSWDFCNRTRRAERRREPDSECSSAEEDSSGLVEKAASENQL